MTEDKARIADRDKETAQEWVSLMLDEPKHHAQGFANWIARNPNRRAYSLDLLRAMQRVTPAAAAMSLPRASRWAGYYGLVNKPPILIAASMLAAVGLLLSVTTGLRSLGSSSLITSATAHTMIRTKIGEVRTERLADGTSVILDTDTLAAVTLEGGRRIVELKHGRARFSVAYDRERPFIVKAGGFEVRPTGKTFDVSYRGDLKVVPVAGDVDVETPPPLGENGKRTIRLRPGEILAFADGQTTAPSVFAARSSEQQWVGGVKSFDDVPVREIIAEANSYSRIRLELADATLGERKLVADIKIRDIDSVTDAIAGFLKLDIDRTHQGRVILTARK
jgi:transmembrane sensor